MPKARFCREKSLNECRHCGRFAFSFSPCVNSSFRTSFAASSFGLLRPQFLNAKTPRARLIRDLPPLEIPLKNSKTLSTAKARPSFSQKILHEKNEYCYEEVFE